MNVKNLRPPVLLQVSDLMNLARLNLVRPDSQTLLWMFKHDGNWILGSLFSVPYWRGNLPFFSYVVMPPDTESKAYLAYKNIGDEEAFFTDSNEDPKYVYGVVIEVTKPPSFLVLAMKRKGKYKGPRPVLTKTRDVNSLVRLCFILSDSMTSPPIWHFKSGDKYVLGILTPFFDYYDANALPVFVYVESDSPPEGGFIKYLATNGKEESGYVQHIGDMKYYYARVVNVIDMPLWPARGSSY